MIVNKNKNTKQNVGIMKLKPIRNQLILLKILIYLKGVLIKYLRIYFQEFNTLVGLLVSKLMIYINAVLNYECY